MERLTPLAATFLEAEDVDPSASLAIGSLAVFEPPMPPFEELRETIRGRLPAIPRYRQKLRTVPFRLAAPAWVDDPDFDLSWHVRSTALPAPGGPEQLGALMSRVMTQRMDRSRPLWEYWFCEGLPEGRWGFLSKLHHSMVDGVSGTDIYRLVLDPTPTPRPPLPDHWTPQPPESTLRYTARAAWDLATLPVRDARALAGAARSPVRLAVRAATSVRGLVTLAGAALPTESSSLSGPLDGSRRYVWAQVSLDDVRRVRVAAGVTVNDVALAIAAGGFRRLLMSRGEEPEPHALRSLVPVSTRPPGSESVMDNQVSLMLPYLPVEVARPYERLAAVHDRVRALRGGHEPEAGGAVTTMAGYGPFGPVALAIRAGLRLPQHQISTVTTNVPGPRSPMWLCGRRLEEVLPYVPIADRVRVGIAIFSYCNTLTFGITGDYSSGADLRVLADGISASMAELLTEATAREPW